MLFTDADDCISEGALELGGEGDGGSAVTPEDVAIGGDRAVIEAVCVDMCHVIQLTRRITRQKQIEVGSTGCAGSM